MYFPFGVQHSRDGGRTWRPVPNRRTPLAFARSVWVAFSGCLAWPIETLSDFREENGCLRVDYFEPVSYTALVDLVYTARYRLETERWDIEYRKLARDAPFPRWIEPDSPWDEWRNPAPPPKEPPFT